jgi:hypothetical protein
VAAHDPDGRTTEHTTEQKAEAAANARLRRIMGQTQKIGVMAIDTVDRRRRSR